ncbi:hypothetical protein GCM10017710_29260 [Arthrobacter ramosus]
MLANGTSSGILLPLRRGMYDADTDRGFGFDKAYSKHGIKSVAAVKFVMNGPGTWQGTDWTTTAYGTKSVADPTAMLRVQSNSDPLQVRITSPRTMANGLEVLSA